jgi:hypothetical protein
MESVLCARIVSTKGKSMIYYVKTGEVDTFVRAPNHRQAAIKALKGSDKNLGMCVMVNEREISECDHEGSVFFLTQSILDDLSMRVVS